MIKSIRNRILLLIATLALAMIAGLVLSFDAEKQRIRQIMMRDLADNAQLLQRVVEYKGKNLKAFAYDYTYWDEMIDCIRNADHEWADEMIKTSLPTYDIEYAWLYTKDLSLVYSTSVDSVELLRFLPLPKEELEQLVATGPHYDFFIKTAETLIHLCGGSVHPTSDMDRTTPAEGYLFVGRIWNDDYLVDLGYFSGSKLSILDLTGSSKPEDFLDPKKFRYVNFKVIEGWKNQPVAYISSEKEVVMAREIHENTSRNLRILGVVFITVLTVLSVLLLSLVNMPLRDLSLSLMNSDPSFIQRLRKKKSEFGHIAQMMTDFFIQKSNLEAEIEERKKVEQELIQAKEKAEESERLKTAFLNNLSHEIRTPMNAIVGFAQLIEDKGTSEAERLEFARLIRESSDSLLSIISDLINLSSLQTGQENLKMELFDLNGFCHEVYHQVSPLFVSKQLAFNLDLTRPDDTVLAVSDRNKLRQILLNLLKNSAKFTQSGQVDFGYRISGNEIMFLVKDTGIGIPPDQFSTVFTSFRQADESATRKYGGAGLGLPISKAYVELMGGRIWLDSEVGQGTSVYFTVPFLEA